MYILGFYQHNTLYQSLTIPPVLLADRQYSRHYTITGLLKASLTYETYAGSCGEYLVNGLVNIN